MSASNAKQQEMAGAHGSKRLAPRVFLAFNDFSLAGPHALRFAEIQGLTKAQAQPDRLGLPAPFAPHVDAWHFVDEAQNPVKALKRLFFLVRLSLSLSLPAIMKISFLVVNNAAIKESEYWALADALTTLLSGANVHLLTIVAALHLPYAKPSTATPTANVYHSVLNVESSFDGSDKEGDTSSAPLPLFTGASFQPVDSSWEVKDRFLSSVVHFLKVEQSPRTHFLLAKGYKPGRDHAGTYEAVDSLAAAVEAFTSANVAFDAQAIKTQLPRKLADKHVDVNAQQENDHHTLLYH